MAALGEARSRFTGPCGRPTWQHIGTLLRCYEPRGATSCGSPMPRGEQIANPTERNTRLVGLFLRLPVKRSESGGAGGTRSSEPLTPGLTSDRHVGDA